MTIRMNSLRHVAPLCAAVCATFSASSSVAQTAIEPQLKETVVTASRIEQALQTAPIGATVILGDDIRSRGMLDANEAVRKLGGVAARSDLNGGREASLDLRGYGDTAANNLVVLVDGIRISENEQASARLSAISPDMIERIEIIRGGASVVWGEGATAGVVNVITRAGKVAGVSGSAQLGIESFGGRDARVFLTTAGEGARFFVQARSYHTNGARENSANSNESLNAGVEVGQDKGFKASLGFFTESQRSRWPGAIDYADFLTTPRKSVNPLDNGKQNEDRLSLALQYRSDAWLFSLDLANRERETRAFNDFGSFGDSESQGSSSSTQISPRVAYNAMWSGTAVNAVLGIDNRNWAFKKQTQFSGFLGSDETATQHNRAQFFKTDFLLPTQTRLVAGLRHENLKQTYQEQLGLAASNNAFNLNAWELGINQTIATGWDAYGRAAKSFRVSNVDENRYFPPAAPVALRPQIAKDAELGLRFSAGRSSAGVRLFRQDTTDEIAFDNATFSNLNLDPVRRTGVELEGRTQLAMDWNLSGSVQALQAKFSSGPNAGKTPPHVSRLNATARLGYAISPAHQVELAVQHRGQAVLGNDGSNSCAQQIPAKTTLDALYRFKATGAADKGWSLTAGVDNLTNAKSFSWAFTNAACNPVNVYPEQGRSLKFNARYAF